MASKNTGNRKKGTARKRAASGGSGRSSTRQTVQKKQPESGSLIFRAEAAVIFFFALSVLLFLSNFGLCGAAGGFLKKLQTGLLGYPGYLLPVLIVIAGFCWIRYQGSARVMLKILAAFFLLIIIGALIHLFSGPSMEESGGAGGLFESGTGGGLLGGALCSFLRSAFGSIGAFLILAVILILLLVALTERSFVGLVKQGGGRAYRHARADLDHYREERRARAIQRMEQRRLEEELNIRNIDFDATDLQKTERPAADFREDAAGDPEMEEDDVIFEVETEIPVQRGDLPETPYVPETSYGQEPPAPMIPAPAGRPAELPGERPEAVRTEFPDWTVPVEEGAVGGEYPEEDPDLLEAFRKADLALASGRRAAAAAPPNIPEIRPIPVISERNPAPAPAAETCAAPAAASQASAPDEAAADHGPAPTVTFSSDEEDEYLAYRSSASAEMDDGNPYTDDEEPVMPSAEELAGPVTGRPAAPAAPGDPSSRTVVTSSGKVIQGEFQAVQKRMEAARKETEAGQIREQAEASAEAAEQIREYRYPPLELLEKGKLNPLAGSDDEYRETAQRLQQTLHSFGVDVTVMNISRGPVVTRYELLPAQGVKVSRIVGLSDDIKLSLAAADIRIEAPVPGKSVVGIEVPNKENNTVYLRDLFESQQFQGSRAKLAFAVGKDIGGQTVVTDIAKMPHLLIAGATGSGKSVCINTLIMSILYKYDPKDVKLIMVDPKVVELSVYNGIPHLLIPVVTDPKKAAGALNWAVAEMTDRYKKFEKTGVRNLKGYNDKILEARKSGTADEEELPQLLPQIVIIIDELADLMMVAKGEVEESICRLAQLARAAGLHLVIATQRPSVNVITGLIKANIPSRIAFAVSSGVDSRTILDSYGAEKLLGKGDMLFAPQGAPRPMRVQGAFVSDGDVQKVVDYIRDEGLPLAYSKETAEQMMRSADSPAAGGGSGRDELFANAGRFIIERKKASIGNLQRMFKIGFNRAARIMDQLSEAGVVGEEQGTKPREILMTAEQFEELLRQTQ